MAIAVSCLQQGTVFGFFWGGLYLLIILGPGNVSVVNLSLVVAILGATGPLRMILSLFPLLQLTVTLNLPWVVGNMPKKSNEKEYYLWS